ncbi:hypothetical protein PPL_04765 [Heterostelium album PN500]|uniref:Uncharacterized protein n=1 Tax=Heterostelium pallidum (strain ATCC 26659 / Pp 5 / PN500) TaxID=670386 RepID=D3B8H2_HETP5|nr:hypothetical protein PPL_04765 [Heterostelium album PN500]EFA82340.1 hypothetical protein PPL_04765 [Heterostelium album PN500]|eukprot:XP_020434457.1 hypothetical protein PPL_04765 [Heterostelium album PN500]
MRRSSLSVVSNKISPYLESIKSKRSNSFSYAKLDNTFCEIQNQLEDEEDEIELSPKPYINMLSGLNKNIDSNNNIDKESKHSDEMNRDNNNNNNNMKMNENDDDESLESDDDNECTSEAIFKKGDFLLKSVENTPIPPRNGKMDSRLAKILMDKNLRSSLKDKALISDKQKYCEFLWKRYTNYRYIPNTTRYINKIFQYQKQPEIIVSDVPLIAETLEQEFQEPATNSSSSDSSSSSEYSMNPDASPVGLVDRVFHYSKHVPVNLKQYNPSPLEKRRLKTDLGVIHVETLKTIPEDVTVKSGVPPLELISHNYKSVELDVTSLKWTKYIPLVTFAISLATSALAIQWRTMNTLFSTPAWLYKIFVSMSSAILALAMTIEVIKHHSGDLLVYHSNVALPDCRYLY